MSSKDEIIGIVGGFLELIAGKRGAQSIDETSGSSDTEDDGMPTQKFTHTLDQQIQWELSENWQQLTTQTEMFTMPSQTTALHHVDVRQCESQEEITDGSGCSRDTHLTTDCKLISREQPDQYASL